MNTPFTMKGEIIRQILEANQTLNLRKEDIFLLDQETGEKVFDECLNHFVISGDRRWWWEDFKYPTFSLNEEDNLNYIDKILPLEEGNVWLIAEDNYEPFYPVFDCNPKIIHRLLAECFYFEFYIIDKQKEWLLCENHHNSLIGIGEKIKKNNLPWTT